MSKAEPNRIFRVHIYVPGDSSVGIWPQSYTLACDNPVNPVLDAEVLDEADRQSYLEDCRRTLSSVFNELFDDFVQVSFDDEGVEA